MSKLSRATLVAVVTCVLLPATASAFRTPFGDRVNAAIERGLQYYRGNENGGNIGGWATGLAMLCFLEKRASADWAAPHVGYRNSLPADQALMQRAARYLINLDGSLRSGNGSYSYGTGAALMGLSLYRQTGGPNNVGAAVNVDTAIANGVNALKRSQGNCGTNIGGWNYHGPGCDGDLSTTQFAVAGLSAAAAIVAGADNTLGRTQTFLRHDQNNCGGGGGCYRGNGGSWNGRPSHSMTASLLWSYRLSGVSQADGNRSQPALRWIDNNWAYQ